MNYFLDRYQIPKLNQDQINNLNSPITPKEIELVIENLPTKKHIGLDGFSAEFYQNFKEDLTPILFKLFPGPDDFSAEFYQNFKGDIIPIFLKLFHKIETEGTLFNVFYEATVTLRPNRERELQTNFPHQYWYELLF